MVVVVGIGDCVEVVVGIGGCVVVVVGVGGFVVVVVAVDCGVGLPGLAEAVVTGWVGEEDETVTVAAAHSLEVTLPLASPL